MTPLFDSAQEQQIVDEYRSGLNTYQIGDLHFCNQSIIYRILRQHLGSLGRRPRKPDTHKRVMELRASGLSRIQIGIELGESQDTVNRIIAYERKGGLSRKKIPELAAAIDYHRLIKNREGDR